MGRVLRLTLLEPDILEATIKAGMTMAGLWTVFPVVWAEQRVTLELKHLAPASAMPMPRP